MSYNISVELNNQVIKLHYYYTNKKHNKRHIVVASRQFKSDNKLIALCQAAL